MKMYIYQSIYVPEPRQIAKITKDDERFCVWVSLK